MIRRLALTLRPAFALSLLALTVACGPLEFTDQVKVRVTLPAGEETEVEEEKAINLGEIEEYKEVAKRAKAPRITAVQLSDNAPEGAVNEATKVSGKLEFSATEEGSEMVTLAEYADFPLGAGEKVDLDLNQEALASLEQLLKADSPSFKVKVTASTDATPLDAELVFDFTYALELSLF